MNNTKRYNRSFAMLDFLYPMQPQLHPSCSALSSKRETEASSVSRLYSVSGSAASSSQPVEGKKESETFSVASNYAASSSLKLGSSSPSFNLVNSPNLNSFRGPLSSNECDSQEDATAIPPDLTLPLNNGMACSSGIGTNGSINDQEGHVHYENIGPLSSDGNASLSQSRAPHQASSASRQSLTTTVRASKKLKITTEWRQIDQTCLWLQRAKFGGTKATKEAINTSPALPSDPADDGIHGGLVPAKEAVSKKRKALIAVEYRYPSLLSNGRQSSVSSLGPYGIESGGDVCGNLADKRVDSVADDDIYNLWWKRQFSSVADEDEQGDLGLLNLSFQSLFKNSLKISPDFPETEFFTRLYRNVQALKAIGATELDFYPFETIPVEHMVPAFTEWNKDVVTLPELRMRSVSKQFKLKNGAGAAALTGDSSPTVPSLSPLEKWDDASTPRAVHDPTPRLAQSCLPEEGALENAIPSSSNPHENEDILEEILFPTDFNPLFPLSSSSNMNSNNIVAPSDANDGFNIVGEGGNDEFRGGGRFSSSSNASQTGNEREKLQKSSSFLLKGGVGSSSMESALLRTNDMFSSSNLDDEFDFEAVESHHPAQQQVSDEDAHPDELNDASFMHLTVKEIQNNSESLHADSEAPIPINDSVCWGEVPGSFQYDVSKIHALLAGYDEVDETHWHDEEQRAIELNALVGYDVRKEIQQSESDKIDREIEKKEKLRVCAELALKYLKTANPSLLDRCLNSVILDENDEAMLFNHTRNERKDDEDFDADKMRVEQEVEEDVQVFDGISHSSRAAQIRLRKKIKKRLLNIDKETRLRMASMGINPLFIQPAQQSSSAFKGIQRKDPRAELSALMDEFKAKTTLEVLNHSFDDDYLNRDPYERGLTGAGAGYDLINTKIALNLYGVAPVTGKGMKVSMTRFHRPDFRTGLIEVKNEGEGYASSVRVLTHSGEFQPWHVRSPYDSEVMRRFKEGEPSLSPSDSLVDGFYKDESSSENNHHPANYFLTPADLSLRDNCPFALLEYVEQFPLLLSNIGMASRITRYYRGGSNRPDQIEKILKGRLGPFGYIRLISDGIQCFGTKMKLRRGQGVAFLENNLFKAPIYCHPSDPSAPIRQSKIFHDHRATDFLLVSVRRSHSRELILRPLHVELTGSGGEGIEAAGCALYTVGQAEPKIEVPSPDSKTYVDERKNQAKAWVLRQALEKNITDIKKMKELVKRKFCPPIPEKEIMQLLRSLAAGGHRIPRVDENAIRRLIRPEVVCALESARAAQQRLKLIGITSTLSADTIAGVASYIEYAENQREERIMLFKKKWKLLKKKKNERMQIKGGSDVSGAAAANTDTFNGRQENSAFNIKDIELRRLSKRAGHLVRLIEEIVLLTPWNLTRDCKEVLKNQGSSQFLLSGFGDPSGGRGEGINLIRRQNREKGGFLSARPRDYGKQQGGIAGTQEDLRKLSMPALRHRLLSYGVSESVLKTLPRWDQVALVRQYRDGFGGLDEGNGGSKGILSPVEYENRLSAIFEQQRKALEASEPEMTDIEGDIDSFENAGEGGGGGITSQEEGGARGGASQAGADSRGGLAKSQKKDEDIEDALLDFLSEKSDNEEADDEEKDRQELEALRQRKEARNAAPMTEEEKQFEEMKYRPIPCIKWVKSFRNHTNEDFSNDKVVYIYGEKNVKAFIEWRERRTKVKRQRVLQANKSKEAMVGKRVCRVCSQPGHIASNPNCPMYRGPKRQSHRVKVLPRKRGMHRSEEMQQRLATNAESYLLDEDENENEDDVFLNLTHEDSFDFPTVYETEKKSSSKSKAEPSDTHKNVAVNELSHHFDDSMKRGIFEDFEVGSASDVSRSRNTSERRSSQRHSQSKHDASGSSLRSLQGAPMQMGAATSRKGIITRSGAAMFGEGYGEAGFYAVGNGHISQPDVHGSISLDSFNSSLSRIVSFAVQQAAYKVFRNPVDESIAPNYYSIIKQPMWLSRMQEKCRKLEYRTKEQFVADMELIVNNCYTFNPETSGSSYLRGRALKLYQDMQEKLSELEQTSDFQEIMINLTRENAMLA